MLVDRREYPRFGTLKKIEDITYAFIREEERKKCALLQAAKVVTNTKTQ